MYGKTREYNISWLTRKKSKTYSNTFDGSFTPVLNLICLQKKNVIFILKINVDKVLRIAEKHVKNYRPSIWQMGQQKMSSKRTFVLHDDKPNICISRKGPTFPNPEANLSRRFLATGSERTLQNYRLLELHNFSLRIRVYSRVMPLPHSHVMEIESIETTQQLQ